MVYLPPVLALVVLLGLLVGHERWKRRRPGHRRFEGVDTGDPGRSQLESQVNQDSGWFG